MAGTTPNPGRRRRIPVPGTISIRRRKPIAEPDPDRRRGGPLADAVSERDALRVAPRFVLAGVRGAWEVRGRGRL